jgi:hypothetical protein
MQTRLSGALEPTKYNGLPVPQVREAKDARPSNGTAWRGRGTLSVFTLLGAKMFETQLVISSSISDFNLSGLESGIYLVRVDVNSEQRLMERIVIIRE